MPVPMFPERGRGAGVNPPNRFDALHVEYDPDCDPGDDLDSPPRVATDLIPDRSRSIIATNDSPDVGFDASINPYRGCEHGCAYCYARPSHEYLGYSAGLDFETKILYKPDAAQLLGAQLSSPRWVPQVVALSGVTDPYQPIERRLEITRGCLKVLAEFRNPVVIITKGALVTRDVDLLASLAENQAVRVGMSVTTLDPKLSRTLEPRASLPRQRLQAIEALTSAGIEVRLMVSPTIPGLTDHEIPSIVAAGASAGARFASYIIVRLPGSVAGIFSQWLTDHAPDKRERVLGRLKQMRGGRLNDPRFGKRMSGEGPLASAIRTMFEAACRKHGVAREAPPLNCADFRVPGQSKQLSLFGD